MREFLTAVLSNTSSACSRRGSVTSDRIRQAHIVEINSHTLLKHINISTCLTRGGVSQVSAHEGLSGAADEVSAHPRAARHDRLHVVRVLDADRHLQIDDTL